MSSANQQNNHHLRTVVSLALLGAMAGSFAWACVSSSSNNTGTGGTAGTTGGSTSTNVGGGAGTANTNVGGHTSAGGAGTAASTLPACPLDAGTIVTGNACTPNPKLFTIQDNTAGTAATGTSCPIAVWAGDGTSSGYFYLPWCNSATASPSDCNLSMACSGGTMHITGTYQASGGTETVDGNGGFGLNLQTTFADAGLGCQMISGAGLTGVTVNITNTTIPGNWLLIGLTLANGDAFEYTNSSLAAGAQTLQIPWSGFTNNLKKCGSLPGPGIVGMYFVFEWMNDGAAHNVDMTLGSLGFY